MIIPFTERRFRSAFPLAFAVAALCAAAMPARADGKSEIGVACVIR